jgi:DNA-binding transcriptional ArsR family regulator
MIRPRTVARSVDNPAIEAVTLQHLLDAMADPVRRMAVAQLARADHALSCGAFDLPVSRSTSTHHFNVLREAGIVRQHYTGTTKVNCLRTEELETRFPGVMPALVAACRREAEESPAPAEGTRRASTRTATPRPA